MSRARPKSAIFITLSSVTRTFLAARSRWMHCGAQRTRGIGGRVEVGAGESQQPPVGPLPSPAPTRPTPWPSEPSSFPLQGPSPVGQSQTPPALGLPNHFSKPSRHLPFPVPGFQSAGSELNPSLLCPVCMGSHGDSLSPWPRISIQAWAQTKQLLPSTQSCT